jgi:hypothetical protein
LVGGSVAVFLAVATCGGAAEHLAHHVGAGGAGGAGSSSKVSSGKGAGVGAGMPEAYADESGTRLKANYVTGADGSRHYLGTFYDSQRAEDCDFQVMSDGSFLCLPTVGVADMFYYAYPDSNCIQSQKFQRIPPFDATAACGATAAPRYYVETDATQCVSNIYSVKSVPTCYQQNGTVCSPIAGACFQVDQAVLLNAFAAGTQAHD